MLSGMKGHGETREFEAVIEAGHGGGAYVEVPFDVKAVLGSARPRVSVSFDGVAYRGTMASMGGTSIIGILKNIRQQIGKDIGDRIHVTVAPDAAPREVTVPDDVRSALRAAKLERAFEQLSYTHRKEHMQAIEAARKTETRSRRIAKLMEQLATQDKSS